MPLKCRELPLQQPLLDTQRLTCKIYSIWGQMQVELTFSKADLMQATCWKEINIYRAARLGGCCS